MFSGEAVAVLPRTVTGTDDFGNDVVAYGAATGAPTWEAARAASWDALASGAWAALLATWGDLADEAWGPTAARAWGSPLASTGMGPIPVEGVLVSPSTTTYDRIQAGRPEGFECDLTLYFPRDFDMDVRGALVEVRGRTYRVVGDPERYTDADLPDACAHNLVVKVARYDV